MARVWIAEQGLHCSLRVGMYAEHGVANEIMAWGLILADMTQHIASALEAEGFGDPADLKLQLTEAFQAEIARPTTSHDTTPGSQAN
jgi:hypothetical protein